MSHAAKENKYKKYKNIVDTNTSPPPPEPYSKTILIP